MKLTRRIIFYSLAIVLLLTILVEIDSIKLNLYKSEFSNQVSSSWDNSSSSYRLDDSNEATSLPEVPVVVVYKSKKVGDVTSKNPIKIDISYQDVGSLWIPLVKKADYNFSINCEDIYELETDAFHAKYKINGEITVSGHYRIIGLCSTEKATDLVIDKVLDEIYKQTQNKFK